MPRPLVVQTEELAPAAVEFLRERCELAACAPGDASRLGELLGRAEGLVVRTYTRVDAAMISRAPRLRVVGRAGVGLDNIDLDACKARGITVVSTPDANTQAVAEYVFAMLFDALRPRAVVDRAFSLDEWNAIRRDLIAPRQLGELILGVLGLGRIGTRVARIGRAMGMRVLYNDLREIPAAQREGAESVLFEDLLRQSHVLTIHVDNRPENRHLINDQALSRLRPDAIVVNTARGFIVDSAALGGYLGANPAAMALLDVHDPEPFRQDYALLGLPNARLSPHLAAATRVAHQNMSWVVRDVWRVLSGERAEYPA